MDPDVLSAVTGQAVSELQLQPAVVSGYQRRLVVGESFPVLVKSAQSKVSGLLIWGLKDIALQRAQFFEGEEYVLQPIQAEGLPESHSTLLMHGVCDALFFADNQRYEIDEADWSLQAWQAAEKSEFLARLNHYMHHFGQMSAAEADQHW